MVKKFLLYQKIINLLNKVKSKELFKMVVMYISYVI